MIAHLGWVREGYVSCPRLAKDIEKGMRQPRPILLDCHIFATPFHGLALGQLIHQLVQVTDFLHQRVFNGLYLYSADGSGDQLPVWVGSRGISEEISVGDAAFHQRVQLFLTVPSEPAGDLIHLRPGTAFFLCFGHQKRYIFFSFI